MPPSTPLPAPPQIGWHRFTARALELFHFYSSWLVSITWKRFILLAVLLLIVAGVLQELPPFSYPVGASAEDMPLVVVSPPPPPLPPRTSPPATPSFKIEKQDHKGRDVTISIDRNGVRISPSPRSQAAAASGASAAEAGSAASQVAMAASASRDGSIEIKLPASADNDDVREAIEEARQAIVEAVHEADDRSEQAAAAARASAKPMRTVKKFRTRRFGDFLISLAWLAIITSAILKVSYKSTVQAEVKAAVATENAESEQLKRQVVEARMAAMQAQVEPHFLFNTLASIDHLIETDPPRASQMQKNLIALLRASMPTLREAPGASQTLGRELAVVRPYLEILKVRMEDRLESTLHIPEGLLSAEFPPMMIQSLVENAIKHGLEPKPEGGRLDVRAEIVDGKLVVAVADTGLGFGKADTAGTGTGLANIRERLQLLYGDKASMQVADNTPTGTVVTLTVPYQAQPAAASRESRTA